MKVNTMYTPWGPPQDVVALAEGVVRIETASHGGLKLSRERWDSLPPAVQETLLTPAYAEEDCEEVMANSARCPDAAGHRRQEGPGVCPQGRHILRPLRPSPSLSP